MTYANTAQTAFEINHLRKAHRTANTPYEEGQRQRGDGAGIHDNPYQWNGTENAEEWACGWMDEDEKIKSEARAETVCKSEPPPPGGSSPANVLRRSEAA
jgi:hypothetical protein